MPKATVRANARTLPEATAYPNANVRALAAEFEAALQAYQAFYHGGGTDDEAAAATDAVKAVAQKIIAVSGTDISIMRLKARVYLWAESTDVEKLAAEGGDWPSEAALASLFRDLGVADAPTQHEEARSTAAPASDTAPHPDAEVFALAEKFEAAWNVERALNKADGITDEELDAANARTEEIVNKIVARTSSNTLMLKLKARAYLWAESRDLEELAPARDMVSDPILVSLFRDLGADRALDLAPSSACAVMGAPEDPIFAAIAQHIVVRDALIEAIPRADKVTAKREGREVTKADEDAVEALNLDEEAALLELFVIIPTTLEGRRALLQHLVQREEDGISEPIGEVAARMLRLPMFAQEEARS